MKYSILVSLLLVIGTGCSHQYYIPTTKMVPLFKEKNEVRALVVGGGANEISTVDAKAAYSITDHIAIAAGYMYGKGGVDSSENRGRGHYFDAAVGYFTTIGDLGVFEVFGGIGTCQQQHFFPPNSGFIIGEANLSSTNIFIQPSFGVSINGFDFAYTSTFSRLNFQNIHVANLGNTSEELELKNLANNRTSYLFEPGITIRGGWKYIKGQFQFTRTFNLSNSQLPFEYGKFSLGIQFAFAERFKNSKN